MKTKIFTASLALASGLFFASNVFAEDYGIVYSGGQNLSASNITINQTLIDGLTPLIRSNSVTKANSASKWVKTGYAIDNDQCYPFHYVAVSKNNPVKSSDNVGFTLTGDQYAADITINGVSSEDLGDKVTTIGIFPGHSSYIYGGWQPFSDNKCQTQVEGVSGISSTNSHDRIFIDTTIKLHKKGSQETFTSNQLYFGITDIDAAQSYKIMNSGNALSPSNMFAKSESVLQPTDTALRNKFVSGTNGSYIYSEYTVGQEPYFISTDSITNVYVKLTEQTQEEGLNMVYGYVGAAGSGIEYFAKQYKVTYKSDDNGVITGIKNEQVVAGKNPTGTTEKPNEDYVSKNWVADINVTLENGTVIKAGDPINEEQIKKVVVNHDITFTILHETEPVPAPEPEPTPEPETPIVPNTGSSTGSTNLVAISTSILGVGLAALLLALVPRFFHKKVQFD